VIVRLLSGLKRKLGVGEDIIEYVVNNSGVWDEPPGDENEISEWRDALTILDIALISRKKGKRGKRVRSQHSTS